MRWLRALVLLTVSSSCGATLGSECASDDQCPVEQSLLCGRTVKVNGAQQGLCFRQCTSTADCATDEGCVPWRTVAGKTSLMCLVRYNDDDA